MRKMVAVVMVGVGLLVVGSCSSNGSSAEEGDASAITAGVASVGTFCGVFASLPRDMPEAYVGSAEHLADVDRMLDASPPEVRDQVGSLRDYVASGSITTDPASKDTANFPPPVQADIAAVRAYAASNC